MRSLRDNQKLKFSYSFHITMHAIFVICIYTSSPYMSESPLKKRWQTLLRREQSQPTIKKEDLKQCLIVYIKYMSLVLLPSITYTFSNNSCFCIFFLLPSITYTFSNNSCFCINFLCLVLGRLYNEHPLVILVSYYIILLDYAI